MLWRTAETPTMKRLLVLFGVALATAVLAQAEDP